MKRSQIIKEAKQLYAGGRTFREIADIFKKNGYRNSNGNYFQFSAIHQMVNGKQGSRRGRPRTRTTNRPIFVNTGNTGNTVATGGTNTTGNTYMTFFKGVNALPIDDATKWTIASLAVGV